jgi:hypothetical protein
MSSRVVITLYDGAMPQRDSDRPDVSLGDNGGGSPSNAPGNMISAWETTATGSFQQLGPAFPLERGLIAVTVIGDTPVQISIGPEESEARYDIVLAMTQRAFGLFAGQKVFLREDA